MKVSSFLYLAAFGLRTILFRREDPILGTVILTDKCNLTCKHCSVNNLRGVLYPYAQVKADMETGGWGRSWRNWKSVLSSPMASA